MTPFNVQEAYDQAVRHHQAGRLDEAEPLYRQILAQQPQQAEVLHYLGMICAKTGRNDLAVDLLRQSVAAEPNSAETHYHLANILRGMGRMEEAIAAYRQAIALNPRMADACNRLGVALQAAGQLDAAVTAWRQAVAIKPDYHQAHNNLGTALNEQGLTDQAIAACRQAIAIKPDYSEAYNNLGNALKDKGLLDDAIAAFHRAIALKPNYPAAYSNLGTALSGIGALDEEIAAFRQALTLDPGDAEAHSNYILGLNFHPGCDGKAIADELSCWNREHAEPLRQFIKPHTNDRNPERRLKIGYVSPDLRGHVVGLFLLPLLENHDHQQFEIFAYAHVPSPDAITQRLRSHTDGWRSLVGLSDAQAADLIRRDGIDILVDLALHAAKNRLLIFAYKPAPLQATYLAYAGSSGLATMDYRLSDPYLDPPELDDSHYCEKTLRLPETFWCYRPVVNVPLQPPPALANGYITFGCLNNFSKVNDPMLNLWAKALAAVPHSRLLLHAHEGSHRQRVMETMQRHGVDPQRVSFAGMTPMIAYFQRYHSIDIALDTQPYGGGTTTCDALWMGVPVVSLKGKTAVGRAGFSILSNVGLPEMVASTPEEYVQIAVKLANDLPRLQDLRATLRQRMEASPLMDAPRFAGNLEAAYRQMWRNYCAPPHANT